MAKCETCNGSGIIDVDCSTCSMTGEVIGYDDDGNETLISCPKCGGLTTVPTTCPTCKGKGTVRSKQDL